MKKIMDLNQAEVAVTTQHLIDIRQERDTQPVKARSYLCLWNGICGYSCFFIFSRLCAGFPS